ncbi:MAG: ComF family protein [Bacteroidales bacterium]|nr:ComF family protein [Bacteroidales bacterium]MCF8389622.1 ComF family protein [Bacteroidales bacterium]
MSLLMDILSFVYPLTCEVCGRMLADSEIVLCSYCNIKLPRSNYHLNDENPMVQLFWGRVEIARASSFFFFYKGSPYQSLLHKLKYKGKKDIGLTLGRLFAAELIETAFSKTDIIIPVPLHPKKKKKRGYNQSEMIAKGMSELFKTELNTQILLRKGYAGTQTNKNRFDRFLNMKDQFSLELPEKIRGKSVLLVDDVVTTGSTLEACAQLLIDAGCKEVSILTLAIA